MQTNHTEQHNPGGHAAHATHGQAMREGRPHSAVDEEHQVHSHGDHEGHSTAMFRDRF